MSIPVITRGPPPPQRPSHTVVFLHGRGDTARNFAASLEMSCDSNGYSLYESFPSVRWVFPQAPTRTLACEPRASWPQWFDVWTTKDFAIREEVSAPGLVEMVPAICDLLATEAAKLDGRYDRVVLAGISMGAATSAHVLFNMDIPDAAGGRLAAFLGFSGRCPFAGRSLADMRKGLALPGVPGHSNVLRRTPMLLEHCTDDPLVKINTGHMLRDTLRGFGAHVEWKEYPTGGHWFHSPTGIDDAIEFLKRNVFDKADNPLAPSSGAGVGPNAMDCS